MAAILVAVFIIFHRPWNYLVMIVLLLAEGMYVWNRIKEGKKKPKSEMEEEQKKVLDKLLWQKEHLQGELKEKQIQYGNVQEQLSDEKLKMSLYTGERKIGIEQVSRGTIEQIYFALRMAASELLHEEEYPVILDDTFVFYDDQRLENTMKWLAEHKKQVLIFTCQKREQQILEKLGIGEKNYVNEN